jgi:hypothetical protein
MSKSIVAASAWLLMTTSWQKMDEQAGTYRRKAKETQGKL